MRTTCLLLPLTLLLLACPGWSQITPETVTWDKTALPPEENRILVWADADECEQVPQSLCFAAAADDFTATGAGFVTRVEFLGSYYGAGAPSQNHSLYLRLYADDSSSLGALLGETEVFLSDETELLGPWMISGGVNIDLTRFELVLAQPLPVPAAGNYWLELGNDTTGIAGDFVLVASDENVTLPGFYYSDVQTGDDWSFLPNAAELLMKVSMREANQITVLDQMEQDLGSLFSDFACDHFACANPVVADDFQLADGASLTHVELIGFYFDTEPTPATDAFRFIVHENDQGAPGRRLYDSLNINTAQRESLGNLAGSPWESFRFEIELPEPVHLKAGQYWIEIFGDTSASAGDFNWLLSLPTESIGVATATEVPGDQWTASATGANMTLRLTADPSQVVTSGGFEPGDLLSWSLAN